jgi:hypothetical protein
VGSNLFIRSSFFDELRLNENLPTRESLLKISLFSSISNSTYFINYYAPAVILISSSVKSFFD